MKVDVTNLQDFVRVNHAEIRRIAKEALHRLPGCYSVVLVDDEQIREINIRYLGRNDVTDVIAFPFDDAPLTKDDCAGEIIVSAQVASNEARLRQIDVNSEIALYVVHGALHLAGYDDHTDEQAADMHQREKEILNSLGYDAEKLWKPLKKRPRRPARTRR